MKMWLVLTSTAGGLKGADGPAFFRPKFYCFPTDLCLGRALLSMQKDRFWEEPGDGWPLWPWGVSPCTGGHPIPLVSLQCLQFLPARHGAVC